MHEEKDGWSFEVVGGQAPVALVLIHDIFGVSPYIAQVAEGLAADGYTSAAVDLFKGRKAKDLAEAMEWRSKLTEAEVLECLVAGRAVVQKHAGATARVGTYGFCMGGGYALLGACRGGFAFGIDFYGKIDHAEDVSGLVGPLLLVLASEDERITPWAFSELLPAAMKAKKRIHTELYPGVRHAFHRPDWEGYNEAAAKDADVRVRTFLAEQRQVATKPVGTTQSK
jgi:carboxymethylenebutenolidase